MQSLSKIVGRDVSLFEDDLQTCALHLNEVVANSGFLVIGGAGTIGQATAKEIFKRNPKLLHVVDVSENNLVELVRDLRSSVGYGSGEFETYALDCGSLEFDSLFQANAEKYDFVLNFSALKHVRSESNAYTLMRLIQTNIVNTITTYRQSVEYGAKKYFCVSTDKAANPVNMMGASKRIMELFLRREASQIPVSMARFANVAFSDGSLLHGFNQRLAKLQPISAPLDVRRYFVTQQESGELCLISAIFGDNLDIFFPKLSESLHLTKFSDIACQFLYDRGFKPYVCDSEQEARELVLHLPEEGYWPCYFFESDTTGEKDFEEFFTSVEDVEWDQFSSIGIIKNFPSCDEQDLLIFERELEALRKSREWSKLDLLKLFNNVLPEFAHMETGRYLNQRM